jgi:uncharacterized membrane protein
MTCPAWRLLTLSDNVVAIALTLLVFQLKVPAVALVRDQDSAADLAAALAKQADQLIGYLVAFYVVPSSGWPTTGSSAG